MKKLFLTSLLLLSSLIFNVHAEDDEHHHPNRHCCKVYAAFYTKDHVEIHREHAIPFDHESDDVTSTGGISHEPGSSDIKIRWPGIYRITYSVSLKDSGGRLALTLDGHIIQGSELFVGAYEQLSTLSVLVKVCNTGCKGKIIRVINNHEASWFHQDIRLKAGHDHENVTAAILIEKIANCPHCCEDEHRVRDQCGNDPCCKDRCEEEECCHEHREPCEGHHCHEE
jgi:hypothetical protein